ncbi:G1 family glutamic endopeptidase [Nocardia sp. IFM 10818]
MKQPAGNSRWRRYCMAALLTVSAAATAATAAEAAADRLAIGNWAGYVVQGDFREVTATWVHPEITCLNPGVLQRVVPWVGLNGAPGHDGRVALPLMQTGIESMCASEAAVIASQPGLHLEDLAAGLAYTDPRLAGRVMNAGDDLSNTLGAATDTLCATAALPTQCHPHQFITAWWEAYPAPPVSYDDARTHPGDTLRSTVTWTGTAYTMTLENLTRSWTRTTITPSTAPARTAEIVIEGHLDAPLPTFTPVTFTNITIDGKPLSSYDAAPYGIAATNRLLSPGPITNSTFTIS